MHLNSCVATFHMVKTDKYRVFYLGGDPMQQRMYPGDMTDESISAIFEGAGDFQRRVLQCGQWSLYAYAIDGLTSGGDISHYVFKPITEHLSANSLEELYRFALEGMIYNSVANACQDLDDVALKLVNGFCVILFPSVGAIAFETKTSDKRGPEPPAVENTAKGPKDAFVETIRSNTSLVRRHLRTPDLRFYETQVGKRSLTNVSVVWVEGITDPVLVERMKRRLSSIQIDGMLSPASVEEYVTGSRATPFPMLQYTERTDRFCQGLLNGRIGLFVDGLPLGYLAPVDIGYLMNSPEDLGRDYISASWVRILRYIALLAGALLPAFYIAMTVYHRQWIPEPIMQMIEEGRDQVPWSSIWEVLGLLIAFELLQESGIHLPQSIGQSVSIIGGIVVGTAAVEAGLISPMALIAISIAGICGFVIPNRDFAAAIRVCRFGLAVLASVLGLIGVGIGLAVIMLHLAGKKSLGVPYFRIFSPTLLRKRLKNEKFRDGNLNPQDKRKQK